MDFAKIVEIFDGHSVSVVSVTQKFNTTTSVGRLTLNVLLSFAQFEREVTAERIRDKIAASKKKGMWMVGVVSLGYKVDNRRLEIVPTEAETLRHLFKRYLELGSVRSLSQEAIASGFVVRTGDKKRLGKAAFVAATSIICSPIQSMSARSGITIKFMRASTSRFSTRTLTIRLNSCSQPRPRRRSPDHVGKQHLLTGLVFDEAGDLLRSAYTSKQGQRYLYYVSKALVDRGQINVGNQDPDGWRLRAGQLESVVEAALIQRLRNPAQLTDS